MYCYGCLKSVHHYCYGIHTPVKKEKNKTSNKNSFFKNVSQFKRFLCDKCRIIGPNKPMVIILLIPLLI